MQFVGLEQDGNQILAALGRRKKSRVEVEKLVSWSISEPNVKQLYKSFFQSTPFVSGLKPSEVLRKQLHVPDASSRNLQKVLPFQIESQVFLKEKNFIGFPILPNSKESQQVDLFLTTPEAVENHVNHWMTYQLDPEQVSFYSLALVRFTKSFFSHLSDSYILHIGNHYLIGIWMKKNLPFKSFFVDFEWEPIKKILEQEKVAEKGWNPSFTKNNKYPEICEWEKTVHRSFHSLGNQEKIPLFITGNAAGYTKWISTCCCSYSNETLQIDKEKTYLHPYAIPIGLSMNALTKDRYAVQFRQKELLPLSFFKKLGKKYLLTLLVFITLSSSFSFFQWYSLKKEKKSLQKRFEETLQKDIKGITHLPFTFPSDLQEKIQKWNTVLEAETQYSKLYTSPQNVSSFLNWLSHHPLLQSNESEVEKVEYTLKTYPSLFSLSQKFQPFVKLTIRFDQPSLWRKFYESLLVDDERIDLQKELVWNQVGNSYEISFYLQARK